MHSLKILKAMIMIFWCNVFSFNSVLCLVWNKCFWRNMDIKVCNFAIHLICPNCQIEHFFRKAVCTWFSEPDVIDFLLESSSSIIRSKELLSWQMLKHHVFQFNFYRLPSFCFLAVSISFNLSSSQLHFGSSWEILLFVLSVSTDQERPVAKKIQCNLN